MIDLLAVVERDGFDESSHHGTAVLLAPDGTVLSAVGDVDAPMLPRSVLKPLFVAGLIGAGRTDAASTDAGPTDAATTDAGPADAEPTDAGLAHDGLAASALELEQHELALASGSVIGARVHLDTAMAMADRLGVAATDLLCTPRRPPGADAATPFGSFCIGKHIAQAAAAATFDSDLPYIDAEHPMQVRLRGVVESLTGVASVATVTDGCGAPVFSSSVLGIARAARLLAVADAHPLSPSMLAVGAAMRARPELVDGDGEPDTELMRRLGVTAKFGAEGTQIIVAPDGTTAVVEVADGARRAGVAAALALLERSGAVPQGAAAQHAEAFGLAVHGGGRRVGTVRAAI